MFYFNRNIKAVINNMLKVVINGLCFQLDLLIFKKKSYHNYDKIPFVKARKY